MSATPGSAWTDEHHKADKRFAERVIDGLHLDGWTLTPTVNVGGRLMPEDFIAGMS